MVGEESTLHTVYAKVQYAFGLEFNLQLNFEATFMAKIKYFVLTAAAALVSRPMPEMHRRTMQTPPTRLQRRLRPYLQRMNS